MLCTLALFPSRLPLPPSKAIHLLSHPHPSNALHCTRSAPSNENSPSSMHPENQRKRKSTPNAMQTSLPSTHPSTHYTGPISDIGSSLCTVSWESEKKGASM